MSETRFSAARLVEIAEEQLAEFGGLHETSPKLSAQIRRYWEDIGLSFPGTDVPWSAVFVSWCMKQAGATREEFAFSSGHWVYVKAAINNADNERGIIRAYPIDQQKVEVGDLIHVNRSNASGTPGTTTYDQARNASGSGYASHCDIVTAVRQGVAEVIGGNLHNTRSREEHLLTPDGFVKQKSTNPYISVVKTSAGQAPEVDEVTGTRIHAAGDPQLWLYAAGRRRKLDTEEEVKELLRAGLLDGRVTMLDVDVLDGIPTFEQARTLD